MNLIGRAMSTAGGDVEAALAASDLVFEHTFSTRPSITATWSRTHVRWPWSPLAPSKSGRVTSRPTVA